MSPWEEHEELRREADRIAAEDVHRHGEDLLERELPYTEQAVAQALTRLERLGARRAELLAVNTREMQAAQRAIDLAGTHLAATGAALESAGLGPACHDLPQRRERRWRSFARAIWLLPEDPMKSYADLLRRRSAARGDLDAARERLELARQRASESAAIADAVARSESTLASELVARYRAALVRNLPPEALADGAGPAAQHANVDTPEWVGTWAAA